MKIQQNILPKADECDILTQIIYGQGCAMQKEDHAVVSCTQLHGEKEQEANRKRIQRVLCIFGVGTLCAIGCIVFSFIYRDASSVHNPNEMKSQILTIAVTILWGSVVIFFWNMKLTPHLCYRRYLKESYSGLSRELVGQVVHFDTQATFRAHLYFYQLVINVGDPEDPNDERLLYWDARLQRPELQEGMQVTVRSHGNDIIGLHRTKEK